MELFSVCLTLLCLANLIDIGYSLISRDWIERDILNRTRPGWLDTDNPDSKIISGVLIGITGMCLVFFIVLLIKFLKPGEPENETDCEETTEQINESAITNSMTTDSTADIVTSKDDTVQL
ncbi:uncharacterized protein LOC131930529 [Physella acuta]|uniref:uncharacterized protein LOC131930529 n=1 Tax=Physella acuta TaxID=109671 RepID=UPI0027DDCE58|nr:uncharacterized protein LOC131930529 [Physella acuta]